MSSRLVKSSVPYVTWTFSEAEFKEMLGITDPESILQVQVSFVSRAVTVTLSPAGEA